MKSSEFLCAALCLALSAVSAGIEDEYGGLTEKWPAEHGTFLFVNAQKTVGEDVFAKPIGDLVVDLNMDIRLVSGTAPEIKSVPGELTRLGAKGAVWIVDDAALPKTLSAVEDGWAFLNVAALVADKPAKDIFERRVVREVYRVFGFLNGTYDPMEMPQCVMKPAHGLKGLDALVCGNYSPGSFMKIQSYMVEDGYKPRLSGTYYDACEEGWAPMPTNAAQKAIWDKVHAMPTKPLTIRRESDRGKGK